MSASVPNLLPWTRESDRRSPTVTAGCLWLRVRTVYAGWYSSGAGKNLRHSWSLPSLSSNCCRNSALRLSPSQSIGSQASGPFGGLQLDVDTRFLSTAVLAWLIPIVEVLRVSVSPLDAVFTRELTTVGLDVAVAWDEDAGFPGRVLHVG